MGTLHQEFWMSEGLGRTRRERQSGAYRYYLPTRLRDMHIALEPDVVGDVSRAEYAIVALNERTAAHRPAFAARRGGLVVFHRRPFDRHAKAFAGGNEPGQPRSVSP